MASDPDASSERRHCRVRERQCPRRVADEADWRPLHLGLLHPPRRTGMISGAVVSLNRTNALRLSNALVHFPSSVASNADATPSVTLSCSSLSVLRLTTITFISRTPTLSSFALSRTAVLPSFRSPEDL
jgi:hypothetical protein